MGSRRWICRVCRQERVLRGARRRGSVGMMDGGKDEQGKVGREGVLLCGVWYVRYGRELVAPLAL